MKNFSVIICLLAIPLLGMAQKSQLKKFYKKYKSYENTTKMTVPGWLIGFGAGMARWFVDDPQARAALKLAKKIKRLRLLVMEGQNPVRNSDMKNLVLAVRKASYEDFVQVRDGNTRVTFMIRERNDKIRNLLIFVSEEDEFILLDLKSKLKIEHINRLLRMLSEDMDIDIPVKTPVPVKKDKIPQV